MSPGGVDASGGIGQSGRKLPDTSDIEEGIAPRPPPSPLGAGYLVLVARELTGLSQRRLARRAGTSQPTLAKIESGSRIPTVRSLLRIAEAAGFELVLGLIGADEDPPLPEELGAFALLGVLRPDPADDLADFVVLKEPSVFEGPSDLPASEPQTYAAASSGSSAGRSKSARALPPPLTISTTAMTINAPATSVDSVNDSSRISDPTITAPIGVTYA